MEMKKVNGENRGKVILYALSTCGWCKKTKMLLNELGVEYWYVDVDQLSGEEKAGIMKEVEKWNPQCSFPTLVLNDRECIVGFKDEQIKRALGK